MHSHHRNKQTWKSLLLHFRKNNSLVWYIEDDYDEHLTDSNGFKDLEQNQDNFVILRKVGYELGPMVNLKFVLVISLSQKIMNFYNNAGNAFKMISSNIGLILIRGHFSEVGRSIRNQMKVNIKQNYYTLKNICDKLGIKYQIIEHNFIMKYGGLSLC